MKNTKNLIAAIFLTGGSMLAAEPLLVGNDAGNEFLKTKPQLTFKKKALKHFSILNRSSSGSGKDWDEAEVTGGGFFINLGIFFPPQNYLNPYRGLFNDTKYGLGIDLDLGSYFRFAKIEDGMMGIGLRLSWLSLSYAARNDGSDRYRSLQIKPIQVGPQISVAINEEMGVDAFYQFGYNVSEVFGAIDDPTKAKDVGESWTFMGFSNEIGAAFHYKIFSFGLGYRFGKLRPVSYVYDGKSEPDVVEFFNAKASVNTFRICLGVRF
jgi:hypothetical protein